MKNRLILKDASDVNFIMGAWVHVRGDPMIHEAEVYKIVKK